MRDANHAITGSIGVDIAVVDAEVRRLRADLESAKEDLQRTHTELAVVQAQLDGSAGRAASRTGEKVKQVHVPQQWHMLPGADLYLAC